MKQIIISALTAIIIIVVLIVILFMYPLFPRPATEEQLQEFREEVELRFKKVDADLDTVKHDLDTLKAGQAVIYEQVKRDKKSFWDFFK